MELLIIFIVASILIIVSSGIMSGSEAAIFSISYPQVKHIISNSKSSGERKRAEKLLKIKSNLQKHITTIVIINNIINIIGSIFIGFVAAKIFGKYYVGFISAILTFLIILFAEIIPKIYGEKYSTKISPYIAPILILLSKVMFPLVWIFTKLTSIFVKVNKVENIVSEGVIREMAILGKQEGSINTYESDLIKNVFEMNDIEVYDILVPRNKVGILNLKSKFKDIIKISKKTGFTRFPILDDSDEVIGMINVKDLFKFHGKEKSFDIRKILRSIEFAPEAMKISTLEQKLRRNKTHMAAIFNEHGDFTGIVTLEDIFEELLGEIHDEFDCEDNLIKKLENKRYLIDGSFDIFDLDEKFKLKLDLSGDYTTLNGFLVNKLGRIPKIDECVTFNKCSFKVLKNNKKQILSVLLRVK